MLVYSLRFHDLVTKHPKGLLTLAFITWKLFLLLIVSLAPGPGYDTSSQLHLGSGYETDHYWTRFLAKFVRWDAIYFTHIASQGYVFEQEHAFGWGFNNVIGLLAQALRTIGFGPRDSFHSEALAGMLLAHISHYVAVIILHAMSLTLFAPLQKSSFVSRFALISSLLHVISPAGVFLNAPYIESPFACMQFLGLWLYVLSKLCAEPESKRNRTMLLASGIALGASTTFRSNGLFSGAIFAYDAIFESLQLVQRKESFSRSVSRLIVIGMAGLAVGLGFAWPQYLAYQQYCQQGEILTSERRSWCIQRLPSVYAFVQDYYWNVGFLHYWTISNIPLFLLAAPMMLIITQSMKWAWSFSPVSEQQAISSTYGDSAKTASEPEQLRQVQAILQRLSIPTVIVGLLTLTTSHVQIITRLASAYPIWYWWLAWQMLSEKFSYPSSGKALSRTFAIEGSVGWMTMYAIVQAGLFASFLPPA